MNPQPLPEPLKGDHIDILKHTNKVQEVVDQMGWIPAALLEDWPAKTEVEAEAVAILQRKHRRQSS